MTQAAQMAYSLAAKATMSNFYLYQNASQSFAATTAAALNCQAALFDDLGECTLGTAAKFTAQQAGTYVFFGGVHGTTTSGPAKILYLFVNGVERVRMQETGSTAGGATFAGSSGPVKLNAGDYVQLYYFSGIADTSTAGSTITYFSGQRTK
jgi:hypothetical protein